MIPLHTLALFPFIFFGFGGLFLLIVSIFWVWMLVDCALNEPNENGSKIAWILVIIFTHFLGAFLYFIIRKQSR